MRRVAFEYDLRDVFDGMITRGVPNLGVELARALYGEASDETIAALENYGIRIVQDGDVPRFSVVDAVRSAMAEAIVGSDAAAHKLAIYPGEPPARCEDVATTAPLIIFDQPNWLGASEGVVINDGLPSFWRHLGRNGSCQMQGRMSEIRAPQPSPGSFWRAGQVKYLPDQWITLGEGAS